MMFNLRRAVGVSIVLYIASFISGIIAGLISGQDMSSMSTISDSFWYVGMATSTILTALFTLWYFKNTSIRPSLLSGFFFALVAVGVSFVLDFTLFSIGNSQGAEVDLGAYYADVRFWIILLLVLFTSTLIGHGKAKEM